MTETLVILMCYCGNPVVLFTHRNNVAELFAYSKAPISQKMDDALTGMCKGANPGKIQVWHLDKLNERNCPTFIRN